MVLTGSKGFSDYFSPDNTEGIIFEFIGGEPFLEVELMDQITDYLIQRMVELDHPWLNRYRLSICSNGVLYFDPRVQAYLKKHAHHLSFSISIDGNKQLHDSCRVFPDGTGSYDLAMKGVRHWKEELHGFMGSKMTLAPSNIMYTSEAVESLIESGYDEIFLNCVYEEGWTLEHAKILYSELKKVADYVLENNLFEEIYLSIFEEHFFHPKKEDDLENWCGGTGKMISCDWKGDIYPCIRYMESSLGTDQKPMTIGNVRDGMMQTCEHKDCVACLRNVDRKTQSTEECFKCPIAEGCSWCSAYNYQKFGTVDHRATFICIMHQARALANAYFWNKGYRLKHQHKRHKLWIPEDWALKIISPDEWAMLKELEAAK